VPHKRLRLLVFLYRLVFSEYPRIFSFWPEPGPSTPFPWGFPSPLFVPLTLVPNPFFAQFVLPPAQFTRYLVWSFLPYFTFSRSFSSGFLLWHKQSILHLISFVGFFFFFFVVFFILFFFNSSPVKPLRRDASLISPFPQASIPSRRLFYRPFPATFLFSLCRA